MRIRKIRTDSSKSIAEVLLEKKEGERIALPPSTWVALLIKGGAPTPLKALEALGYHMAHGYLQPVTINGATMVMLTDLGEEKIRGMIKSVAATN